MGISLQFIDTIPTTNSQHFFAKIFIHFLKKGSGSQVSALQRYINTLSIYIGNQVAGTVVRLYPVGSSELAMKVKNCPFFQATLLGIGYNFLCNAFDAQEDVVILETNSFV